MSTYLEFAKSSGSLRWPRGMSAAMAASYLGITLTQFRREVAAGRMPVPVTLARQEVWLREDLDDLLDNLAGKPDA